MGLTAYILDKGLRARASIPAGCIAEMVHSEADGGLRAEIAIGYNPRVGEYIGFMCRDGRFRAFEIERTEQVDEEGIDEITATDAARTWMRHHVVESAQIAGKTAVSATESVLAGAGWEIGKATATGTVGDVPVYYETAESALAKVADTSKSEIIPYYVFVRGAVSTRKVDVLTQEPTYRGRIISPKTASQIGLIEDGLPMTRVYPVGRATGTGLEQTRVTIGEAVWSTASGDPADKPAGQTWVAIPGAEDDGTVRGYVYPANGIDDPVELMVEAYKDLEGKAAPTRSGTARAGDVSYLPGYTMHDIRTGDLVGIRTRWGNVLGERVANVNWDYVRPNMTRLEFGQRVNREWITSKIEQNATELLSIGGSVGRIGGRVSVLGEEVEENAMELYQAIEQLVELESGTATQFNEVWIDLDATNARLEGKAESTTVNALGERVGTAEFELDALEAQVLLRATVSDVTTGFSEVEVRLDAQEGQLALKADLITLQGYTTVDQLNASIADLLYANSQTLETLLLNAEDGNFTYLDAASFTFGDELVSKRNVTLGKVSSAGKALSTGAMDLSHSHSVSVSDDGTVTFGEAVEVADAGNFRIADTKAYKDGVAAAKAGVTLSAAGWVGSSNVVSASNGKSVAVNLPTFSTSGGESWTDDYKTTVYFSTPSVNGPLASVVVDASGLVEETEPELYGQGWGPGGSYYVVDKKSAIGYAVPLPQFASSIGGWDDGVATVSLNWIDDTYGYSHLAESVQVEIPDISVSWSNPAQYYAMVTVSVGGKSIRSSENISGYV